MGINKVWLQDQQFARSVVRQIDRETLIDLMGIVIYGKRSINHGLVA